MPLDKNSKTTTNEYDTYIKGKYKTEVFRYDDKTLAIQFISNSTVNNIIPQLKELGVNLKLFVEGDNESVYLFSEIDLKKINSLLKFQKKGAKISPKSVKTARLGKKLKIKK